MEEPKQRSSSSSSSLYCAHKYAKHVCVREQGVCVGVCESVCALTDDKFLEICQHLGKDAQVLEGLPGWGA